LVEQTVAGSRGRSGGRHDEAARNDQALLDAARVVFAVHGADAPVSLIAERAGTGIGSLYRRYPTKEALLQHLCLAAMADTIAGADEALADDDPWRGLTTFVERCAGNRYGAFIGVGRGITTTPEMNRTFKRSQDKLDALVARAHAARRLRADVNAIDLRLLIELFSRRPPDDQTFRRGLAIAIDGLRVGGRRAPLPSPVPTWDDYVRRWHAP
jgi:AcrR family transcriptional regulator